MAVTNRRGTGEFNKRENARKLDVRSLRMDRDAPRERSEEDAPRVCIYTAERRSFAAVEDAQKRNWT